VGTAARVRRAIEGETDLPVHVCSNPEFLKEGAAVDDFMKPDRVVLGVDDPKAGEVLRDLYSPFVRTGNDILLMDVASAEITKYAANAMLATRISFMNSIAQLCELTGADVTNVRMGVGSDGRIGPSFLFPGVGYGGSCFPKDVKALIRMGQEAGTRMHVIEAVDRTNEAQKSILVPRIAAHLGGLAGKVVAVWGLAFKPRTDDIREAPAIAVIEGLLAGGAAVRAYDPKAEESARRVFGDRIALCQRAYEAVRGADALVVVTEWNEFREPDFGKLKARMRHPALFDGRDIYNPQAVREMGFHYEGIGRR
jgi:UDPglucose 6-dehydrogenase